MGDSGKKAVARYRRRARRKGLVRVEVQVPREDADTVRTVARALRSGDQDVARRTRVELLQVAQSVRPHGGLKALLEAAPLDGVELERPRDLGRLVELD